MGARARRALGLAAVWAVLILLLVEGGLRLSGSIVLRLQDRRNLAALRDAGSLRILCVGDSMTKGQYPALLEKALNSRGLGIRFAVADRGIPGTQSEAVVDRLETELDRYRPDMVLAMMGATDREAFQTGRAALFLSRVGDLRVVRLLKWARMLVYRACQDEAFASAQRLRWEGRLPEAEQALRAVLRDRPGDGQALMELGFLHLVANRTQDAERDFRRLGRLHPNDCGHHIGMAMVYESRGMRERSDEEVIAAIRKSPDGVIPQQRFLGMNWRRFGARGDFASVRRAIEGFIAEHPSAEPAMRASLALAACLETGAQPPAAEPQGGKLSTATQFLRLKGILDRRGIRLVCVQYPLRSIEPLRRAFLGRDDGVIFVDNQKVFLEAVRRHGLARYFAEMNMGDFGHCTRAGNELLAANIADTLVTELFSKGGPAPRGGG